MFKTANPEGTSLAAHIAQQLREDILEGRLVPGIKIGQEALAERYGTSRLPVRLAIRELAADGLVVSEPNVGARVAPLHFEDLIEVYLMRERLEPLAISQSIHNLSDEQIRRLRELIKEMELAGQSDPQSWVELDTQFHLESYLGAPFPRLLGVIDTLFARAQQYRRVYLKLPQTLEFSNLEHQLLIEALERRDGQDAEQLLHIHIRRTRLGFLRHPELLEGNQPGAAAT
ncbi:MAG: GntR family transcriptional regulator [Chloroflexota bacterium]